MSSPFTFQWSIPLLPVRYARPFHAREEIRRRSSAHLHSERNRGGIHRSLVCIPYIFSVLHPAEGAVKVHLTDGESLYVLPRRHSSRQFSNSPECSRKTLTLLLHGNVSQRYLRPAVDTVVRHASLWRKGAFYFCNQRQKHRIRCAPR